MMFSRISSYVEQPKVFGVIFEVQRLGYSSFQMWWWCPLIFPCRKKPMVNKGLYLNPNGQYHGSRNDEES